MSMGRYPRGERHACAATIGACVFTALASSLAARPPDALERAWVGATGRPICEAHAAFGKLVAAGDAAVTLLGAEVSPPKPVDGRRVRTLIAQLDDNAFSVRKKAFQQLSLLDRLAEPHLARAAARKLSAEASARVAELLAAARSPLPTTPSAQQAFEAVRVLERIGSPRARALLKTLAGGAPDARLTQDARAALQRLQAGRAVAFFDRIDVRMSGFRQGRADFTITATGDVSYRTVLRDGKKREVTFRLSGEHLRQFESLLAATRWLTAPGAVNRGATDQTTFAITVVHAGVSARVASYNPDAAAYRSLTWFLSRIWRQESILARLQSDRPAARRDACHEVQQEIQADLGAAIAFRPRRILDYRRLVPHFAAILAEPDARTPPELMAGAKLAGYLHAQSFRAPLVKLTRYAEPDKRDDVRAAVVAALGQLGGPESLRVLTDLAEDGRYRIDVSAALVQAGGAKALPVLRNLLLNKPGEGPALAMIRLGDPAAPYIIEVLRKSVAVDGGGYHILRTLHDHWLAIPKPLAPQLIAALRRPVGPRDRHRGGYQAVVKLLDASDQPGDAREVFRHLLDRLAKSDATAGRKLFPIRNDDERRAVDLLRRGGAKAVVRDVYAHRSDCFAIVVAGQEHFVLNIYTRGGNDWQAQPVRHVKLSADGKRYYGIDPGAFRFPTERAVVTVPSPPTPTTLSAAPVVPKRHKDVYAVAHKFLAALADRNGEAMGVLILESRPDWVRDQMPDLSRRLRGKLYASHPERLTDIREIVREGDLAAARIPGPGDSQGRYIYLILQRVRRQWRIRLLGDTGSQAAAPALQTILARQAKLWAAEEAPLGSKPLAAGQVDALWKALADEDAEVACRAVITLADAGDQGVELLAERVGPLLARVDPKRISEWIAELDSPKAAVREAATRALIAAGPPAAPALQATLARTTSPEVRAKIPGILDAIDTTFASSADARRLARITWAWELLGTDKAVQLTRRLGATDGAFPKEGAVRRSSLRALTHELGAARAASSRGDWLLADYRAMRPAGYRPIGRSFVKVAVAFLEASARYPRTEIDAYCRLRLSGYYQYTGHWDRKVRELGRSAQIFAGTAHEARIRLTMGLHYLQGLHNPAKAIDWFESVDRLAGAMTPPSGTQADLLNWQHNRDSLRMSTAQTLARCRRELADRAEADRTPWQAPVGGLRVRLRVIAHGEGRRAPRLALDRHYVGTQARQVSSSRTVAEVQVGGKWYARRPSKDSQLGWLRPDSQHYGRVIVLGRYWLAKDNGTPLTLAPGSHTVRAACILDPVDGSDRKPLRVEAGPVTVEVK